MSKEKYISSHASLGYSKTCYRALYLALSPFFQKWPDETVKIFTKSSGDKVNMSS